MSALKPNFQIKDYQIHLPPLGEGTFGAVYRATYRGISERALKVFKPHTVDLPAMSRELEKLSSVAEHSGIVTLHDFDLLSNTPYYAMSLHADEGEDGVWRARTLEQLCGKLDPKEANRLIEQLVDALSYLHRHQLLHCDLKPSNLLLTDENPPRVKVCDFGQSRASNLASMDIAGTPLYSSPEQLRRPHDSAEGKGFRWDVYSFGAVAYRLITGRLPRLRHLAEGPSEMNEDFDGSLVDGTTLDTSMTERTGFSSEKFAALLEAEPEISWPSNIRVNENLKAVITRCLSLDPDERPADMRDVRVELTRRTQERRAIRARRLALLFAGISALAIAATGVALFQAKRAHDAIESEQMARRNAEGLVNFILFDLRDNLRPSGQQELLEHIAENAEDYFSSLSENTQTEQSRRTVATILQNRGDLNVARGQFDEAIESYTKAFHLYDQLRSRADDPDGPMTYRASEALVSLADVYQITGDTKQAVETYDRALAMRNLEEPSGAPREIFLKTTIQILLKHSSLLVDQGDLDEALAGYEKAVELATLLAGMEEQQTPALNLATLVRTHMFLGDALRLSENYEEAETHYELATQTGKSNADLFQSDQLIQTAVARALRALGDLKRMQGETTAALVQYRQEMLLRENLYAKQPADVNAAISLAECHARVAQCYDPSEKVERELMVANYDRAIDLLESKLNRPRRANQVEEMIADYRGEVSKLLELDE